jgi:hypothetical protein
MNSSNYRALAVTALASATLLLAACEDGSDFGPGSESIEIIIENPGGGGGGGGGGNNGGSDTVGGRPVAEGLVDNPNDPIPEGAVLGKVASDDGDSATGPTPDPEPVVEDPYAIADFFAAMSAEPPVNNSEDIRGAIDSTGMPIGSPARLQADFTVPDNWPPASATDANSLPVPGYIQSTSYIGAMEPGRNRDQQWTADWTIGLNGNFAVWGANVTSMPVSDETCPDGTTFAGSFSDLIGPLGNDAAGLFSGSVADGDYDVCTLERRYDTDGQTVTLTADNVYNIADGFPGTKVGNGDLEEASNPANAASVELIIEPGTLIYGEPQEALVITRGSSVQVNGEQDAPVVMTSGTQLTRRFDGDPNTLDGSQAGEWAGFALMGYARTNECGGNFDSCNVVAEGGIGNYGGNDDEDSSGNVNHLVIRHAGNDLDGAGNELNGFTLFGVGRNTELQHVQIHRGFDDGIEFFGGNAFIRYLLLTGNGDDSLDYDSGWTGGAQNVLIVQEGSPRSNNGIEADSKFDQLPITFELISNLTIIGPTGRSSSNPPSGDEGIRFREGKRAQVHNAIVTGEYENCINFNDADTFNRANEAGGTAPDAPGPHLIFRNTIVDCINFANYEHE